ncbi:hypothetical protein [Paenibacillus plantiphilus]|uniref:hypothetical protein n=1 Tax=Paenibacillus plantiphilus TaxID=2905650 RepID=UPI001F237E01|nr:hypothetical protein [Paenibacillus plantiphilus]
MGTISSDWERLGNIRRLRLYGKEAGVECACFFVLLMLIDGMLVPAGRELLRFCALPSTPAPL